MCPNTDSSASGNVLSRAVCPYLVKFDIEATPLDKYSDRNPDWDYDRFFE